MARTKKQTGRKYYITSEVFDSSQMPDFIKEMCFKEKATFRRSVPTEVVEAEDLKGAQEKTTKVLKLISLSEEGDVSFIDTEFTSWDTETWRHYFIPKTLEDLENFLRNVDLEATLTIYDFENLDEDQEAWAETQIGMPLPEENAVIVEFVNQFMLHGGFGEDDEDEE